MPLKFNRKNMEKERHHGRVVSATLLWCISWRVRVWLGLTSDWKSLSVDLAVNEYFFELGKCKVAKGERNALLFICCVQDTVDSSPPLSYGHQAMETLYFNLKESISKTYLK